VQAPLKSPGADTAAPSVQEVGYREIMSSKIKSLLRSAARKAVDFGPVKDHIDGLAPATKTQTKRSLIKTGVERSRCQWCKHFDLESGQEAMKANAAFFQAAQILTPDHMEAVELRKRDEEGRVVVETNTKTREKLGHGKAHTWKSYGACHRYEEVRHEDDSCEEWS